MGRPTDKGPDNTTTLEFDRTRSTKGTVVFTERRDDGERQHTFYMLKGLYESLGSPDAIYMTIERD